MNTAERIEPRDWRAEQSAYVRHMHALVMVWVTAHTEGRTDDAVVAAEAVAGGHSLGYETGCKRGYDDDIFAATLSYRYGPIGGIHPSHTEEDKSRWMAETRELCMRRVAAIAGWHVRQWAEDLENSK